MRVLLVVSVHVCAVDVCLSVLFKAAAFHWMKLRENFPADFSREITDTYLPSCLLGSASCFLCVVGLKGLTA